MTKVNDTCKEHSGHNIWSRFAIVLIAASLGISYSFGFWNYQAKIVLREILEFESRYLNPLFYIVCLNSVLLSISYPVELVVGMTSKLLHKSVFYTWSSSFTSIVLLLLSIHISTIITFSFIRLSIFSEFKEEISRYRLFRVINQMAKSNAVLIVVLVRLSLFMPFTFSNLILGFTDISLLKVIIGNFAMSLAIFSLFSSSMNVFPLRFESSEHEEEAALFNMIQKIDQLINYPMLYTCTIVLVMLIIHRYLLMKENDQILLNSNSNDLSTSHLIYTDEPKEV